jgi:hypothetical protein
MIQGISSTIPVIVSNIMGLRYSSAKLAYPVRSDQAVAAQFKHIVTYPAQEGIGSASIFKLRILDNLIEQLSGTQGLGKEYLRISNDNIDSLIAKLRSEAAINKAAGKSGYNGLKPGTGLILDTYA